MSAELHPLAGLGRLVQQLDVALKDPAIAGLIGPGLAREFRMPVVAYRTRFGETMPEAQQDLFSAPVEASG
ncbi:MAG: hypothetical protein ACTHOH_18870 [Lysobacteraceae bacterium]